MAKVATIDMPFSDLRQQPLRASRAASGSGGGGSGGGSTVIAPQAVGFARLQADARQVRPTFPVSMRLCRALGVSIHAATLEKGHVLAHPGVISPAHFQGPGASQRRPGQPGLTRLLWTRVDYSELH